jgi:ABC-type nitrate/sulfonate/bicarbonate transport system permease component
MRSLNSWQRIQRWLYPIAVLAGLLVAWELWVLVADTPRWMLPPPIAIVEAMRDDHDLLLHHTRVTLLEIFLGFSLSLVTGLLIGIAISQSSILERAMYPLIIASQTIPMVALAPLMLIWFGYGLLPKILITALVGFFPIAVNTVDGLRTADRDVLALLTSMGAGRWQQFRLVRFPSALPLVFSGARVAITLCVIGAVFSELVGASEGLGYLMQRSASQFQTPRIFACIFILATLGIGFFAIVSVLERLVLPWRRYITDESGRT